MFGFEMVEMRSKNSVDLDDSAVVEVFDRILNIAFRTSGQWRTPMSVILKLRLRPDTPKMKI